MVLWEITLGTAYFLGLKRTYRLALKIQRRLISAKHPKIRQFARRRTRAVFDIALKVHRNIQERDIEVGRNLGNWILRWLDRIKPSAQIRGPSPPGPTCNSSSTMNMTTQLKNSPKLKAPEGLNPHKKGESDRHLFSSGAMWSKQFPSVTMMMRSAKPVGSMTQFRHLSTHRPTLLQLNNARGEWDGVIRKDIMQWMLQK